MSNALATTSPPKLPAWRIALDDLKPEFERALPGHIPVDRFMRTAQTAVSMTRNIEKLKDMRSFKACVTKAAQDGLILDGREAALVIDYNGEAQYRPMVRGLLKLAYNSGEIKSIVVELARENDLFDYEPTNPEEPVRHKIDLRKPRGEAFAGYAIATLKDGGVIHEVMSVEDINRIRNRSDAWRAFQAKKIKSTPWATDWEEMARKTVLRRISKYLPSSTDRDEFMQAVSRLDDDYTDLEVNDAGETVPAGPQPKKRGGAAAALKNVTPQKQAAPEPEPEIEEAEYDEETGEVVRNDDPDMQAGDDI